MRKSPALRIAVALSGALSVVVAIALGGGQASASRSLETTVRLAAVAHAIVEQGSAASADRLEVAPARPAKDSPWACDLAGPALPATPAVPEIAAACAVGARREAALVALHGCEPPRAPSARGPPSRG